MKAIEQVGIPVMVENISRLLGNQTKINIKINEKPIHI
jgi:hypothetical protein